MKPSTMRLTIGVVSSLLLSIECMTLHKGPFQSVKAPSETIYNYSVVHPHISDTTGSKNGKHPLQLTVTINEVTLHLTLNEGLLPGHFVSKHFNERGEAVITRGYENCYYHGRVEGHSDWKVTMSTCSGLKGSYGDRSNREHLFHIEPLDASNDQLDGPHVVYPESEYSVRETSCGTPHSPATAPEVHELPVEVAKDRLKRQNSLGERIVEWAVVNDAAQLQQYGSIQGATNRSIELANYLDMLYRDEYQIRIVLTYVENWSAGDRINVVTDSSGLLDIFEDYSEFGISVHRDSTMLLTGINLDGSTVGIANVAGMCTTRRSVGLTQDSGDSVASTGAVAAHELGHIFNMQHDNNRGCTCNDPAGSNRCIMAASGGFPPSTQWSSCSRDDLNAGFDQFGLDVCLNNEPAVILGEPVCGNGLVEEGEVCDCGPPEICPDPCCNATSCMLREGAECFSGACCNNCQFRPYGTTCRENNNECGITEYCSGDSSDCPDDFVLQDGTICGGNTSYCFSGTCITYNVQCQRYWGTNNGIDECYLENTQGTDRGNCGHNPATQQYIPCADQDVMCGLLFCQFGSNFNNVDNIQGFLITNTAQDPDGNLQRCSGAVTFPDQDFQNPTLVDDFTRCGVDRVCSQRRCVPLSSLNIPPCPTGSSGEICSGNGVCNNDNMCSCNIGFTGSVCDIFVELPSVPSGPSAGAVAGGIIAALIILALIVGGVVLTVFLVKHFKKSGKYTSTRTTTSRTNYPSKPSSSATTVNVRQPYKSPPSQPARRPPPPTRPANNPPRQPSRPPQPHTNPTASKPATRAPPPSRAPPPKPNMQAPQFTPQPPAKPVKPLLPNKPQAPAKPSAPPKPAKPLPASRTQWPPKP